MKALALAILGGGVVALVVVAASSSSSSKRASSSSTTPLPLPMRMTSADYYAKASALYPLPGAPGSWQAGFSGAPGSYPVPAYTEALWTKAWVQGQGAPGHWGADNIPAWLQNVASYQRDVFQKRLVAAAKKNPKIDPYPGPDSTQNYLVFRMAEGTSPVYPPGVNIGTLGSPVAPFQYWGWVLVDQLGRPYGYYTPGGNTVLADTLGLASAVATFIPGGAAAKAAIAAAIALGQGKGLKSAAIAAARANLPPGSQQAFDVGVAVASGTPLDQAAKNALLSNPAVKKAYAQGAALAHQTGLA